MKKKKSKHKSKKGRGMSKGSAFERTMCKKLSRWWSGGERDDIFWRTSGSGARAKVRSKTKQATFGQYGDVQATDPIGQPLIDAATIELKRGYYSSTLSDLIDRKKRSKEGLYLKFIKQVIKDSRIRDDGSEWILIVKRDRREPILFTPYKFYRDLLECKSKRRDEKFYYITGEGSMGLKWRIDGKVCTILICPLEWFLKRISSQDIKDYSCGKK